MREDNQSDNYQPPIGVAGLACLGCFAVLYLATKPFMIFRDVWWARWSLLTLIPISVVFTILYRSSWHQELGRVTRIFSMMLSSCILFCCVLLVGGITIGGLFVVLNRFTAFHY